MGVFWVEVGDIVTAVVGVDESVGDVDDAVVGALVGVGEGVIVGTEEDVGGVGGSF